MPWSGDLLSSRFGDEEVGGYVEVVGDCTLDVIDSGVRTVLWERTQMVQGVSGKFQGDGLVGEGGMGEKLGETPLQFSDVGRDTCGNVNSDILREVNVRAVRLFR